MFIGFNLHRGTVAIDKIILRPGKVPASLYQKNSDGDPEPESESEDDKNKDDLKSCEEKGNCKKE